MVASQQSPRESSQLKDCGINPYNLFGDDWVTPKRRVAKNKADGKTNKKSKKISEAQSIKQLNVPTDSRETDLVVCNENVRRVIINDVGDNNNTTRLKPTVGGNDNLVGVSIPVHDLTHDTDIGDGIQVAVDNGDLEAFDAEEERARCANINVDQTMDMDTIDEDNGGSNQPQLHCSNRENSVILTKATRDWLAEQRRQDEIRMKKLMKELLDEKFDKSDGTGKCNNVQRGTFPRGTGKAFSTNNRDENMVKSPSDTTIYAPALNKSPQIDCMVTGVCSSPGVNGRPNQVISNSIMQKINDFVGSVRAETPGRGTSGQQQQQTNNANPVQSTVAVAGQEEAQQRVDRALIEAEKFKATVNTPAPGEFNLTSLEINDNGQQNLVNKSPPVPNIGEGVSDDDFFHLTCHIDPNLIQKIESGEFVDLDKLLPKDKISGLGSKLSDDNRMEWVHRDGGTYLVPANGDSKMTGIRRWEQAFRIYATIYCGANPHRAKEIWQYIAVINTAASAYYWDNVYNYDITFRHLMAFNPNRSWAVTYNQMWNLAMKDPLPHNSSVVTPGRSFNSTEASNGKNKLKIKPDYCWNFNKGIKCKFGSKCKFIERCSYCDSPSHPIISCRKAQKKGIVSGNKMGPSRSHSTGASGHSSAAGDK